MAATTTSAMPTSTGISWNPGATDVATGVRSLWKASGGSSAFMRKTPTT